MRHAVLLVALLAAVLAPPAAAQTLAPGTLTVGLSMPSEGFQVGVVNGPQVLYARGFEVDLATELARRMGLAPAFSQNAFPTLVAPGAKPWDVALAEVAMTGARRRNVDFSVPYLRVDQGVLVSQFLRSPPRSVAALRGLRLCAMRGTTGAGVIARRIRPTAASRLLPDTNELLLYLQLGRCDAIVYDLPSLATLKARAPNSVGSVVGRIRTDERYGVVLPKGSPLRPGVDAAITAMRADGTITRLQRPWMVVDLSSVPTLSTRR